VYTVSFPVLESGFPSGISLCYIGLTCRKDYNPVMTVRPFRSFIRSSPSFIPLLSLFPIASSLEDNPIISTVRSVMPTSSGSYARTTGLRSHGPVDEQPSASAGPVQPIPSRMQQSGTHLPPTVPSGSSGSGPVPQSMTVLPFPPCASPLTPPRPPLPSLIPRRCSRAPRKFLCQRW
jgi:hypothetical protein